MAGVGIVDGEHEFVHVVIQFHVELVHAGLHARVVAVVALQAFVEAFGAAAVIQVQAFADIGIAVPAVNHALVEAMYVPERLARRRA